MLKVLLVDDEVNVIEGMKLSVDWETHGFVIAGEAYDGKEGLEKALTLKPDLVITDITMPVMDGIDMAEKIKAALPYVKLIFLTCHEDFGYARNAVRLNAVEYLIKVTMTREELYAVLEKVKHEIEADFQKKEKEMRISRELAQNRYLIGETFINDLFNGKITEIQKTENRLELYGYHLKNACFVFSLLKLDRHSSLTDDRLPDNASEMRFAVLNCIDDVLKKYHAGEAFSKGRNEYIILFNIGILISIERVKRICREIQEHFKDVLKTTCTLYLGNRIKSLHSIPEAYKRIKHLENKRFYMPDEVIIVQEDTEMESENGNGPVDPAECVEAFKKAFKELDTKSIDEAIDGFIDKSCKVRLNADIVKNMTEDIFLLLINNLERFGCRQHQLFRKSYAEVVEDCQNISQIKEVVREYASKALELISKNAVFSYSNIIKKVDRFIKNNLQNQIGINLVASHVNMNSSYFSRYFKNKTGENFVDYLARVRIEKAKELLLETDYTIDQIAEMVGHVNKAYFTKVFKKLTGLNPGEFRKRLQENGRK